MLAQREAVEAGYRTLLESRARYETLNSRLGALLKLNERRNSLARLVEEARARLQADQRALAAAAEELERRGAGLDHPVLPGLPETEYLKAWFLRVL
jgi:23S rRNA G2069 N7-methylase RlmK/C1962 C5-methylase RlmI